MSLYRFAFSISSQEATAKDIVQQTFLQWARKGHALRDSSKVKTWLFTTIRREWLALVRRDRKYRQVEFDPEQHGIPQENGNEAPPVTMPMLRRALAQLSPRYRVTLVFFYLKELSYREMADVLGVPVGTVMSRLFRAKNVLRHILLSFEEVNTRTSMAIPQWRESPPSISELTPLQTRPQTSAIISTPHRPAVAVGVPTLVGSDHVRSKRQ